MAGRSGRVFLDSNVILSGLFSEAGPPRIILDLFCLDLPMIQGMTGAFNLVEIERNLKKKMPAALPIYHEYFSKIRLEVIPMPPLALVKKLSGSTADKDLAVLASALTGKADYLVTGDKKDFSKKKLKGDYPFRVVTPAEFLDQVLPEMIRELGKE
jgi:predicted nucleic acid-binding protein